MYPYGTYELCNIPMEFAKGVQCTAHENDKDSQHIEHGRISVENQLIT